MPAKRDPKLTLLSMMGMCLTFASLAVTSLFTMVFHVSAKDDFGADLFEDKGERDRKMIEMLEQHFGARARELLAGRYRKPVRGRT
jgi:hypothetical protein